MVVRSKGVSGQEQALQWDANNRLAQVVSSSGVTETYLYDEQGQRIRRQAVYSSTVGDTAGDTVTYVPFVFYEQAVSAGGSVVTRHYTVNGERVAVRVGGALYYLYHDQVGSTILATDAFTNVVGSRGYYAFGATRRSSGLTPTDRRFTGQVEDGTGLYYYNSRYYDPQLGQFLSPDTIVPEPTNLLSYNRYLYVMGNPLKYSDPTGHQASCAAGDNWCWQNRWYNARGYFWNGTDWGATGNPMFSDEGVLDEMMGDAGIGFVDGSASWNFARKQPVASGVALLARSLQRGFTRLAELLGGAVEMHLQAGNPTDCSGSPACALPPYVRNANGAFTVQWSANFIDTRNAVFVGGTAVHELAHVMDWRSFEVAGGTPSNLLGTADQSFSGRWWPYAPITSYAACQHCVPAWEKWAEAVTYSVFGQSYVNNSNNQFNLRLQPGTPALNIQMTRISEMLNGRR